MLQSIQLHNNLKSESNSLWRPNNFIQTKLKIGRPGDKYEQEADWVADAVMRMPDSGMKMQTKKVSKQLQMQLAPQKELQMKQKQSGVHQMCPRCRERFRQRKPIDCPECSKKLQMKSGNKKKSQTQTAPDMTRQLETSKGSGSPLPSRVQRKMSDKIGADFGNVNIHTGSKAIQMNQALGARAFTHGRDIYFNRGQYDPASSGGKHLLAHELAHVAQQESKRIRVVQRQRDEPFKDLSKLSEIYKKANRKTKSCIGILNQAIRKVYEGELSDVELQSTIQDTMAALRAADLVGDPHIFQFKDTSGNITHGLNRPDKLAQSVETKVKSLSTDKGWYLFGLSIMDGYHSVLLGVYVSDDSKRVFWMDQVVGADEVTGGLDAKIEKKTRGWWQGVKQAKGVKYRTRSIVWPFVEPGLMGTMGGEKPTRSYIPPEGGGRIPER